MFQYHHKKVSVFMTLVLLFNVMYLFYDDPCSDILYEVSKKERLTWRPRLSVCDLVSAAKPFVGFSAQMNCCSSCPYF